MRSAFSLFRTYTFILRKGVDSGLADRMRNPRVRNIHPAVSHGFSGSGEKVSGRISYLCPGFRTLQQPMPDSVQKPMNDKTKILFVCLGNICRSPAAEGILRAMAARRGVAGSIEADSAGTYGGHAGQLPDTRMRRAAAQRGYDLTHRARQVREADFERFDMIVVMDDMNYEALHRLAPPRAAAQRIFRMTEFCRRHPDRSYVPDPYYEGHEGFELVLDLLEDGCEGILEHIGKEKAATCKR